MKMTWHNSKKASNKEWQIWRTLEQNKQLSLCHFARWQCRKCIALDAAVRLSRRHQTRDEFNVTLMTLSCFLLELMTPSAWCELQKTTCWWHFIQIMSLWMVHSGGTFYFISFLIFLLLKVVVHIIVYWKYTTITLH